MKYPLTLYKNILLTLDEHGGIIRRQSMNAQPPFTKDYPGQVGAEITAPFAWYYPSKNSAISTNHDTWLRHDEGARFAVETWACQTLAPVYHTKDFEHSGVFRPSGDPGGPSERRVEVVHFWEIATQTLYPLDLENYDYIMDLPFTLACSHIRMMGLVHYEETPR